MSARFAGSVGLAAVVAVLAACGGGHGAEAVKPGLYAFDASNHSLKLLLAGKHEREDVSWSADGKWVASTDIGDFLVDVVRSTGGGLRDLDSVSWSPDGKTVAYSKGERLYVARTDWSRPRLVSGDRESDPLDWSPDGRSLIFGTGRDSSCCWNKIGVARADGTGVHLLGTQPSGRPILWSVYSARSSPNGRQIAVSAGLNSQDDCLCVLNVAHGGVTKLTEDVDSTTPFGWSDDGKGLAFVNEPTIGRSPVYRVGAAGGKPQSLCPQVCHSAVFSKDGSRVAFVSGPTSKPTLWVEGVDGTGLRRIGSDLRAVHIVWSPDGRKLGLTLATPDGKHSSIAVADLGTNKVTRFAEGSDNEDVADLSSDGSMVAFYRAGSDRRPSLWVASTSGGDPVPVMELSSNPELGPCPHVAWSPKAPILAIANEACEPD